MTHEHNNIGGVMDEAQSKNKIKVQPKKQEETKPGFGNKKIEGPDRPST